jgi:hypothetical protein
MPRPKAYVPPVITVTSKTPREAIPTGETQATLTRKPRHSILDVPLDQRTGKSRPVPDMSSTSSLSIDKHVDKQKYKIVYILDKLTDDLARAASSPRKKDKEYIKGLVWSVGVLFDKLANGVQQDAVVIRIPTRLLDSVKAVIGIQVGKKDKGIDRQSNPPTIDTTGYVVPVADPVAELAPPASLAPSLSSVQPSDSTSETADTAAENGTRA